PRSRSRRRPARRGARRGRRPARPHAPRARSRGSRRRGRRPGARRGSPAAASPRRARDRPGRAAPRRQPSRPTLVDGTPAVNGGLGVRRASTVYQANARSLTQGRRSLMARQYRIVSADSHTLEPPDLWEKWLEKKYQDTAPRLVEDKDGGSAWIYMGAT